MGFTYQRDLTDEEIAVLQNDIVDVKQWIDFAIEGKINSCKKRIQKQIVEAGELAELQALDPDPVRAFLKKSGYKNREQREDRGRA